MLRNAHSSRSSVRNTILGLLGAIGLSGLPAVAQSLPGRILVEYTSGKSRSLDPSSRAFIAMKNRGGEDDENGNL